MNLWTPQRRLWLPSLPAPTPQECVRNWGEPWVRNAIQDGGNPNKPPNSGGGGGGGGGPALGAPSSLTATPSGSTAMNLGWTDNAGAEGGFKVERAASAVGPWTQIGTAAANATTYADSGLTAETTYYYRVRAYNGSRNGKYSNTANGTTGAAVGTLVADASGLWGFEDTNWVDALALRNLTGINSPTTAAGKDGNAVEFTAGSSQRLEGSAVDIAALDGFYVCCWVRMASYGPGHKRLVAQGNNSSAANQQFVLSLTTGALPYFLVRGNAGAEIAIAEHGTGVTTLNWHFVEGWWDDTTSTAYVNINNGTPVSNTNASLTAVNTVVGDLAVGDFDGGSSQAYDGRLDTLLLKGSIPSADTRTWLYNGGTGRTVSEILAYSP